MLERVIHIILDTIFPISCAGCGISGTAICHDCLIHARTSARSCFFCSQITSNQNHICLACSKKSNLDSIHWAWKYTDPRAKKIIERFKYKNRRQLAPILANEIHRYLPDMPGYMLVPIPLHTSRLRERGFNQAELLAKNLGGHLFSNILVRTKNTSPQARSTSRRERYNHMKNAFDVRAGSDIKDKVIVLIDDVATTGATLESAARTLKRAGALHIHAVALAHG